MLETDGMWEESNLSPSSKYLVLQKGIGKFFPLLPGSESDNKQW